MFVALSATVYCPLPQFHFLLIMTMATREGKSKLEKQSFFAGRDQHANAKVIVRFFFVFPELVLRT